MPEPKESWRVELTAPGAANPEEVQKKLRFKPNKDYILRIARSKGAAKGEGMYTIIKIDAQGGETVEEEIDILPEMIETANAGPQAPPGTTYLPPPPQQTAPAASKSIEDRYASLVEAGEFEKAQNLYAVIKLKEDSKGKERAAMMGFSEDGRGNQNQGELSVDKMTFTQLMESAKKRKFMELLNANKIDEALQMGSGNQPQQQGGIGSINLPPGTPTTGDPMVDAATAYDQRMKAWMRLRGIDPDRLSTGGMSISSNENIAREQLQDLRDARKEARADAAWGRVITVAQALGEKFLPVIDRLIPKQAGFGDINTYLQQQGQVPVAGTPNALPAPSMVLPGAPQRAVVQQTDPVYVGPGAAAVVPQAPLPAVSRPVSGLSRVPVQTSVSQVQVEEGATEVLGILDETVNAIIANASNPAQSAPEEMIRTLHTMGQLKPDQLGKLLTLRQRGVRNLVSQYASYIAQLEGFPNIPPDQQRTVMSAVKAYRPATFEEIVRVKAAMTQTNPGYDPESLAIMIRNQQTTIMFPVVRDLAQKLKVLTTPHGISWVERAVEEAARIGGTGPAPAPTMLPPPPPAAPAIPVQARAPPIDPVAAIKASGRVPSAAELVAIEKAPRDGSRVPTVGNTDPTYRRVPDGWEDDVRAEVKDAQQPPPPDAPRPAPAPVTAPQVAPALVPVVQALTEATYRAALKPSLDELRALISDEAQWLTDAQRDGLEGTIRSVETSEISRMYQEGQTLEYVISFLKMGVPEIRGMIETFKTQHVKAPEPASPAPAPEPEALPPETPTPVVQPTIEQHPEPKLAPKAPEPPQELIRVVDPELDQPEPEAPVQAPEEPPEAPVKGRRAKKPPCAFMLKDGRQCSHEWQVEVDGEKLCAPHGRVRRDERKAKKE